MFIGRPEGIFIFEDDSSILSWRSMIFRILVLQSTLDPKDINLFNNQTGIPSTMLSLGNWVGGQNTYIYTHIYLYIFSAFITTPIVKV